MIKTDKFATPEQIEELKGLLKTANEMPVMKLSMASPDFSAGARERMFKQVHKYALETGLPEIEGYYGCDLETGEFVKT